MINEYVSIDLEMTGLSPLKDKIIEVGAVYVKNNKIEAELSMLINPNIIIPDEIVRLTGITQDMVKDKPKIHEVIGKILEFIEGKVIIGHYVLMDYSFIKQAQKDFCIGEKLPSGVNNTQLGIDTLKIARKYFEKIEDKRLYNLCKTFEIPCTKNHRAQDDAKITSDLYMKMCTVLEERNIEIKAEPLIFKTKKQQPIPKKQVEYLRRLVNYHQMDLNIDFEKLTQSQGNRLADKIILENGRIK